MSNILSVSTAQEWRGLLAADYHWKPGYSACTLASCWMASDGFPSEVAEAFRQSNEPLLANIQPLVAAPEFKVPLPGGKRASQSDLFVLARSSAGLVTIVVEGKVQESFGPTLKDWESGKDNGSKNGNKESSISPGKKTRLAFLLNTLGLPISISKRTRYQLLHRTASALITAEQFHAKAAVMLIHAFAKPNEKCSGWHDYDAFTGLFHVDAKAGVAQRLLGPTVPLFAIWVDGNPTFLQSEAFSANGEVL